MWFRRRQNLDDDSGMRNVELFTKGVELLGRGTLEQRVGGVYALVKLAAEVDHYYWPVITTLTAFIRENAPWPPRPSRDEIRAEVLETQIEAAAVDGSDRSVLERVEEVSCPKWLDLERLYDGARFQVSFDRTDIRAAEEFLVKNRRPDIEDSVRYPTATNRIDLRKTDLRAVEWHGINLAEAILEDSCLVRGNLFSANLRSALLDGAQLQCAYLNNSTLTAASLRKAELQGSYLAEAKLERADLWEADLNGAHLRSALLLGANLYKAELENVDLYGASLQGASLNGANLHGAELLHTDFTLTDLRDVNLQNCRDWESISSIRGANIHGVKNAPEGFQEWALNAEELGGGAVAIADDNEWVNFLHENARRWRIDISAD